jgi:hypothetical protein
VEITLPGLAGFEGEFHVHSGVPVAWHRHIDVPILFECTRLRTRARAKNRNDLTRASLKARRILYTR